MTDTANLALPFIDGSQAQKHITHNEALRILDAAIQVGVLDMTLTSPPPTPADGERHVVASGATGAWAGQANAIAVWEDGAWRFLVPKAGWSLWSVADSNLFVYDGTHWTGLSGGGTPTLDNAPHVGINSTATSPNLLSVRSNSALFNSIDSTDGGSGDARIQISKEGSANTASVVFSDAFSGRAEFGLVGSDDFKLKVSDDGTTFIEAFTIDRTSGNLALPRGLALTGVASPAQITANQNDYDPAGLASASILQISSDASRSLSGLAGGAEGRLICILNVGSQTVTLQDENASSTEANRFTLGANLVLAAKQAVMLRYDGTAARWFALARPGGSGGGLSIGSSADLAAAISDETGSGSLVFASSPTLDGTPLAPTAAVDTNTTQIATTAFVLAQASASGDGSPAANGTASRGSSTHYARADHIHPTDTGRAPASNIALSALAAQASNTFVGNVSGSSASPSALTVAQVTAALVTMTGDSGGGGAKGLVPAPGAGDASAGKFLKADGTYAVPPGTGGGGSYPDINRRNALLEGICISKLFGGYRRVLNEFHDGYKASDGINSGSSTNVSVDAVNGCLGQTTGGGSQISVTSFIGNMTGNGGLASIFNGATNSSNTASGFISLASGASGYAGANFSSSPKQIGYVKIFGTNNFGYCSAGLVSVTVELRGSATAPTSASDGTLLGTLTFTTGTNESTGRSITSSDPSTAWAYVWCKLTSAAGGNGFFAEIQLFTPVTINNMVAVTTAQTSDAPVSNARVLIDYDDTSGPTLNTDLSVEVTCDGGSNWTAALLSSVGTGQAGRNVAETVDQACTSGSSFAARIMTFNNKNVPIYGATITVH